MQEPLFLIFLVLICSSAALPPPSLHHKSRLTSRVRMGVKRGTRAASLGFKMGVPPRALQDLMVAAHQHDLRYCVDDGLPTSHGNPAWSSGVLADTFDSPSSRPGAGVLGLADEPVMTSSSSPPPHPAQYIVDDLRKPTTTAPQSFLRSLCYAPRGQFPHPLDCRKFVDCWDGRVREKYCPDDQAFSDLTGGFCDYLEYVDCGNRPMSNVTASAPSTTTTTSRPSTTRAPPPPTTTASTTTPVSSWQQPATWGPPPSTTSAPGTDSPSRFWPPVRLFLKPVRRY